MGNDKQLRCRANALTSHISVFHSQCPHLAKGERIMSGGMLPACARHLQIKFTVDAYRKELNGEAEVREYR